LSAYRKGRRLEYRVRDFLKSRGWWVVRQARSSFPDLVALKKDAKPLLIECRVDGCVSKEEKEKLSELAGKLGAIALIASRKGKFLYWKHVAVGEEEFLHSTRAACGSCVD